MSEHTHTLDPVIMQKTIARGEEVGFWDAERGLDEGVWHSSSYKYPSSFLKGYRAGQKRFRGESNA